MLPDGLTPSEWALWGFTMVLIAGLFSLAATVVFDVIHLLLHVLMGRPGLLGRIGALHDAHHKFVDEKLMRHPEWEKANLWMHVVPEYLTQVVVGIAFSFVVGVVPGVLAQVLFLIGFLGNFFYYRGYDFNHELKGPLPRAATHLWVTPSYHLLHHVYPNQFFASYVPLLDKLVGRALPIAGRTFAVTGASGAFGAPLCAMLEKRGARIIRLKHGADWSYGDLSGARAALLGADVLVLAHGSKVKDAMQANCTSFVDFIELFKSVTKDRIVPPEVWALGSEIEAHPHFGVEELKVYSASKRAFALHARRYYRARDILYRHIVPSAFTSPMGPGLMSGRVCARVALFFMMRGVRYVPVTYTGIALLNALKFILPTPSAPAPAHSVHRPVYTEGAGLTPMAQASSSPA
jgi:monoglucosyldiacylglycerol epimerase